MTQRSAYLKNFCKDGVVLMWENIYFYLYKQTYKQCNKLNSHWALWPWGDGPVNRTETFGSTTSLKHNLSWWRHQMETFSALLAICAGNSPVPVKSPHKGQWRGTLMFTLICARINGWVNNCEAGDFKRNRAHYDVIVMVRWSNDVYVL